MISLNFLYLERQKSYDLFSIYSVILFLDLIIEISHDAHISFHHLKFPSFFGTWKKRSKNEFGPWHHLFHRKHFGFFLQFCGMSQLFHFPMLKINDSPIFDKEIESLENSLKKVVWLWIKALDPFSLINWQKRELLKLDCSNEMIDVCHVFSSNEIISRK